MDRAPIIVFGYNRATHIYKTLKALSDNYISSESVVYVYLDGKKDDDVSRKVEDTFDVVQKFEYKYKFKDFIVKKSDTNKGLATSIIEGVSEIIKQYGKVIVLEDDLITSKDFLSFMNDALVYYEDYNNIWSVSGFSQNMTALKKIKEKVYFTKRATSWGWATWVDRWEQCDWSVSDYQSFRYNPLKRYRFNLAGTDLSSMLDRQMAGVIDSWAIRWCYSQSLLSTLTVCPLKSKIENIGADGSGINSGSESDINHSCYSFGEDEYSFVEPYLDRSLVKEFQKRNELSIVSRISRYIKYNVIRL